MEKYHVSDIFRLEDVTKENIIRELIDMEARGDQSIK